MQYIPETTSFLFYSIFRYFSAVRWKVIRIHALKTIRDISVWTRTSLLLIAARLTLMNLWPAVMCRLTQNIRWGSYFVIFPVDLLNGIWCSQTNIHLRNETLDLSYNHWNVQRYKDKSRIVFRKLQFDISDSVVPLQVFSGNECQSGNWGEAGNAAL